MALAVTAMLFSHIMLHLHECCRMAPLSKPHGHCIAHQHAALCCVKWQLRSLQPSDLMAWWVKGSLVFSEAPQALYVLLVDRSSLVCCPRLQAFHLASSREGCADCKHPICMRTQCGVPMTEAEHAEMSPITGLEHCR